MDSFTFPTGRTYGRPQILAITIEGSETDEYGLTEYTASFTDDARHIRGRVSVLALDTDPRDKIGRAVLAEYDAGRYNLIVEV